MKFPPGSTSPGLRPFFRVSPEATVTALANCHHFHEVLRPYSVFRSRASDRDLPVQTHRLRRFHVLDGSAPAISASISRCNRSWGSPFEASPSHLIPSRCRVRDEGRAPRIPPVRLPCGFARQPFPIAYSDEKFAGCTIGSVSGLCSL